MAPLQTPVVPAIIKSTLAAPANDDFYHTHLKMLKIPRKFGGRQLGAAGGAWAAEYPARFDSKASSLAAIIQIFPIASAEAPEGSSHGFMGQQIPAPWGFRFASQQAARKALNSAFHTHMEQRKLPPPQTPCSEAICEG